MINTIILWINNIIKPRPESSVQFGFTKFEVDRGMWKIGIEKRNWMLKKIDHLLQNIVSNKITTQIKKEQANILNQTW